MDPKPEDITQQFLGMAFDLVEKSRTNIPIADIQRDLPSVIYGCAMAICSELAAIKERLTKPS